MMARGELVDSWSSKEMISILEADTINTLLPAPLPDDVAIAHKTGPFSTRSTMPASSTPATAPYVIAVMTTALHSKDAGRAFIHTISRLAYVDELERRALAYDDGLGADVRSRRPKRARRRPVRRPTCIIGAPTPPRRENAQPQTVEENAPAQSVEDDAAPTSPPTP